MTHNYSADMVALIKRTAGSDLSPDELELFLYTCYRTGLDPLARQIYAIKRGGRMTIQTAIDGYRAIADRTGKLAGISDPIFDSEEGKNPKKATVTVKKVVESHLADFTATARWGEYNAGGPMWSKMAYLMLGKCAEALALRKAFPADLSGVYTTEEMQQADNGQQEAAVVAEVERQKAAYTPTATNTTLIGTLTDDMNRASYEAHLADKGLTPGFVPPELDWSYQKTTGVLICRPQSIVSRKRKTGAGQYMTIELNNKIDGSNIATYFHASHVKELAIAGGKVCKFMVSMSKDGKFVNIDEVLEIDGKHIDKAPADDSAEFKARALASTMDWTEDDLRELHTRWCHNSWEETLVRLEARQAELAGKMAPVTEEEIPF